MLFDKKKVASVASGRASEGKIEHASDEFALLASDIKKAVNSGSDEELARALKAFFYACDAKPHEEGSHE